MKLELDKKELKLLLVAIDIAVASGQKGMRTDTIGRIYKKLETAFLGGKIILGKKPHFQPNVK